MSCKILAFGEVLWDVFPDKAVIGGAPFNFAAHTVKQGAITQLISAVGNDDLALKTIEEIKNKNVSYDYIGHLDFPTGRCDVTLNNGIPSYDLIKNTAYDNIILTYEQLNTIAKVKFDYLYCGTLALRNEVSFNTFKILANGFTNRIICDVNIRQNYYSKELIKYIFNIASIIKISREELPIVANLLNMSNKIDAFSSEIFEKYANVSLLVITLDKDGAVAYDREKKPVYSILPTSKVVSTVGAGDSFFASFIVAYHSKLSIKECLDRAVKVSDYVVTKLEAIPDIPSEIM